MKIGQHTNLVTVHDENGNLLDTIKPEVFEHIRGPIEAITKERDELKAKCERLCARGIEDMKVDIYELKSELRAAINRFGALKEVNRELTEECVECKEENQEIKALFELQQTRMAEAVKIWQSETGNECWPDLGNLLAWFMDQLAHEKSEVERLTEALQSILHTTECDNSYDIARDAIEWVDKQAKED